MGFLDNTTITVDAILTRKGREKLASFGSFDIVYYAFADDEIDYNLYDVTHPQGSTYYGAVLENMPLLESFVDETQVMRYKLFTNENKDLNTLSYVTVGGNTTAGNNETITLVDIATANFSNDDTYKFTLLNTNVFSMTDSSGNRGTLTRRGGSQVVRNTSSVVLTPKDLTGLTNPITKTVVFIESEGTGASTSITITNTHT
jgi:hypothetical protein|tara:strand:+ start:8887 stop:9492 length:606 start_codon:yes stop_codon:yes gene_type:complete